MRNILLADILRKKRLNFYLTEDMGTLVECGIAFGMNQKDTRKRKLVWYAETLGDNPFNLMLANSGDVIITSFDDLNNLPEYLEKGQIYEGKVQ